MSQFAVLTSFERIHTVTLAMIKWTTSALLIIALSFSVLAGMPFHASEQECSMSGMTGMDCCKTAHGHGNESEVAMARLCCSVNCPQSGTTGSSSVRVPKASLILDVAFHPTKLDDGPPIIRVVDGHYSHSPPQRSNPTYFRNLALLI